MADSTSQNTEMMVNRIVIQGPQDFPSVRLPIQVTYALTEVLDKV